MNTAKEIGILTLKVTVGLMVLSLGLNFIGINIFSLIASPFATVKALVTPAAKTA